MDNFIKNICITNNYKYIQLFEHKNYIHFKEYLLNYILDCINYNSFRVLKAIIELNIQYIGVNNCVSKYLFISFYNNNFRIYFYLIKKFKINRCDYLYNHHYKQCILNHNTCYFKNINFKNSIIKNIINKYNITFNEILVKDDYGNDIVKNSLLSNNFPLFTYLINKFNFDINYFRDNNIPILYTTNILNSNNNKYIINYKHFLNNYDFDISDFNNYNNYINIFDTKYITHSIIIFLIIKYDFSFTKNDIINFFKYFISTNNINNYFFKFLIIRYTTLPNIKYDILKIMYDHSTNFTIYNHLIDNFYITKNDILHFSYNNTNIAFISYLIDHFIFTKADILLCGIFNVLHNISYLTNNSNNVKNILNKFNITNLDLFDYYLQNKISLSLRLIYDHYLFNKYLNLKI